MYVLTLPKYWWFCIHFWCVLSISIGYTTKTCTDRDCIVFVFLEKGLFLYIQMWFFVRNFNSHLYYLQVVLCKIMIIKLFVKLLFWGMISDGTEMFLFVWLILQELRSYGRFCSGVRNISWMSAGGSVWPAKDCLVQCMSVFLLVRIFLMQPWGVSGKECSVPEDVETEPQLSKGK